MPSITVIPKLEALEAVNAFLEERLEEAGCPMKAQMQLMTVAEEVYVNIAHYSGANEATVDIEFSQGEIRLTLTDDGAPYDPLAREDPDVTLSAEERGIGGLGIFMVKKMTDEQKYERKDGRNCLMLVKRMK